MITDVHTTPREFRAPQSMSTSELGETLARLVWEHFSDFVSEDEDALAEEALIFFLWAHTHGAELAFAGRTDHELLTEALDHMHRAVFEDMVGHGTPKERVPMFEQRAAARYATYRSAAERSVVALGRAVARHLVGIEAGSEDTVRSLAERAIAVADPLRDFLEDVELVA